MESYKEETNEGTRLHTRRCVVIVLVGGDNLFFGRAAGHRNRFPHYTLVRSLEDIGIPISVTVIKYPLVSLPAGSASAVELQLQLSLPAHPLRHGTILLL